MKKEIQVICVGTPSLPIDSRGCAEIMSVLIGNMVKYGFVARPGQHFTNALAGGESYVRSSLGGSAVRWLANQVNWCLSTPRSAGSNATGHQRAISTKAKCIFFSLSLSPQKR